MTSKGLYCPAGQFYIDPSRAVECAVITHAHSDHARKGSQLYYCVDSGVSLLKTRIGNNISVSPHAYSEIFEINGVNVSFHPAGPILGSSQVRLELNGEVWGASGDYKREKDPTCEPFEVVTCDVFVTEATFGTPGFAWNHPSATAINDCYRAHGVPMAPTRCLSRVESDRVLTGELFIVPHGGYDHGFLMSDHADWNELVCMILETKAKKAFVQHRGKGALVKHLSLF